MIGFLYFSNFLALYGININPLNSGTFSVSSVAPVENGVQVIDMTVNYDGYSPNSFTVRKGIPVKWIIQGVNVFGCQAYFVAPSLGIQKVIDPGENIIEFTPQVSGPINFSCGMGMYRGQISVI
jgi:plastocyanin domain-containing protein